jgi:hypothetical protein
LPAEASAAQQQDFYPVLPQEEKLALAGTPVNP